MGRGREICALAAAVSVAAAVLIGCDGDETKVTASEFVEEINAQGVEIELGRPLQGAENRELHEVTLAPLPGLPPPAPGEHEEEHGGKEGVTGTLYVFDDSEGANAQLAACRSSGGLVCYRASNVVVLFEEAGIEAQRLAVAMQGLADE